MAMTGRYSVSGPGLDKPRPAASAGAALNFAQRQAELLPRAGATFYVRDADGRTVAWAEREQDGAVITVLNTSEGRRR